MRYFSMVNALISERRCLDLRNFRAAIQELRRTGSALQRGISHFHASRMQNMHSTTVYRRRYLHDVCTGRAFPCT